MWNILYLLVYPAALQKLLFHHTLIFYGHKIDVYHYPTYLHYNRYFFIIHLTKRLIRKLFLPNSFLFVLTQLYIFMMALICFACPFMTIRVFCLFRWYWFCIISHSHLLWLSSSRLSKPYKPACFIQSNYVLARYISTTGSARFVKEKMGLAWKVLLFNNKGSIRYGT